MKKVSRVAILMLLVSVMMVPAVLAQVPKPEKTSTWTISDPTWVGNTLLQPGTYTIRVVSRPSDRNMVRVMSVDEQTLYATVLTIPHALEPGEDRPNSMFVFYPAIPGEARALRTWFPADAPSGGGHDIVYDEDRARMLAQATRTTVVSYPATTQVTELETVELRPVLIETETRVTTPAPPPAPVVIAETRTELPETASSTPFIALLGLLSVAGAVVIRFANR